MLRITVSLVMGILSWPLETFSQVSPPAVAPVVAPTPAPATNPIAGIVGAIAGALAPSPPPATKASNSIGPDLNKLFLCKRDISQDADMCKRYITFFCSGYCTHDGCSDCSNRGICVDVCGEAGVTMMSCVEANKNCPSPDQVFGNFLTPDAKTAIQAYASQPGQPQFAVAPQGVPGMGAMGGGMPGMMPGISPMGGGMPGMMPGMGAMGGGMPGMMPGMSPMGGMPGMSPMGGYPMGGAMPGMSPVGAMAGMAAVSMFKKPKTGASAASMGPTE